MESRRVGFAASDRPKVLVDRRGLARYGHGPVDVDPTRADDMKPRFILLSGRHGFVCPYADCNGL
jgi:hypothetical protein